MGKSQQNARVDSTDPLDPPKFRSERVTSYDVTRRSVLTAGLGALAASGLPVNLEHAVARGRSAEAEPDIKHVWLYMQENRSFDHYFGTLRGVRGLGDPATLRRRVGGPLTAQARVGKLAVRRHESDVKPFLIRDAANSDSGHAQYVASLPHSYPDGVAAWNRGWWDHWIPAKTESTMGYYDRSDLPMHYALADTFTVCDHYFASIMAGTSPNRNYWFTGTSGDEPDFPRGRAVDNRAYSEDRHSGYTWPTQAELLQDAGVAWQVYQEWDNFTNNQLEFFATFKGVARAALATVDGGAHSTCSGFYTSLFDRSDDDVERLLAELDQAVEQLPARDRDLFNRGLRRHRPGSLARVIERDAARGQLATVLYVVPPSHQSEHPAGSSPVGGAHFSAALLNIVGGYDDVWDHSVLLYTYDEFDGFFDHMPPPVPPHGDPDEWNGARPMGMGARVPALVISPWSVGGAVCSQVFDHTSAVQLVERVTGVACPNISAWRRSVSGDLMSCLDLSAGAPYRPGGAAPQIPAFTGRWNPESPGHMAPRVERGSRPSRPVPYQLSAAIGHGEAGDLTVSVRNTGPKPAPVALYLWQGFHGEPRHGVAHEQWTSDVAAPWGGFAFTVTGPDGWQCDVRSERSRLPLAVSTSADQARGVLSVRLAVSGGESAAFTFDDGSGTPTLHTVAEDKPLVVQAAAPGGRYQVNLVGADESWHVELRGRVETGLIAPSEAQVSRDEAH